MDSPKVAAGRARAAWLVGGLAACLLADGLLTPILVRSKPAPLLAAWAEGAHVAGNGAVLAAVGGLLWLLGVSGAKRLERGGLWVFATLLLTGFWSHVGKRLIGRPRPRLLLEGDWLPHGPSLVASWDSFPSGHAMGTVAVAVVLAALFPRLRWLWLGVAALIALGRVVGGDHYLTDVLAGGAMGWLLGSYAAERWRAEWADAPA